MTIDYTPFSEIYDIFLSKITDDLYMELTYEETLLLLEELLRTSIHKFEFPRVNLNEIEEITITEDDEGNPLPTPEVFWAFVNKLSEEEKNILASYMIVEWLGQQIASIEVTRMKYSSNDFKMTSQANHLAKLLQAKKEYEKEGFHLQRLYSRRLKSDSGLYQSTFSSIMANGVDWSTELEANYGI